VNPFKNKNREAKAKYRTKKLAQMPRLMGPLKWQWQCEMSQCNWSK